MDLRIFYRKMREVEAAIAEDPTLVISVETSDGGKPGVISEVRREVAARLLVEGRARLTDKEEASEYRALTSRARLAQEASARQVQLTVISEAELRSLRDKGRQKG
jgi:hypothetical protein